jgi:hypothetical protein
MAAALPCRANATSTGLLGGHTLARYGAMTRMPIRCKGPHKALRRKRVATTYSWMVEVLAAVSERAAAGSSLTLVNYEEAGGAGPGCIEKPRPASGPPDAGRGFLAASASYGIDQPVTCVEAATIRAPRPLASGVTLPRVRARIAGSKGGGNENGCGAGERYKAGRVPGLNTERIYTTTIPAEELGRALADHFRAQGFETQVFRTSGNRVAMQARKESLWRNLLGVAYALTVIFAPAEDRLSIGLGGMSGSMRR